TENALRRTIPDKVLSIEKFGEEETFDLEVSDNPHNFLANGFIVHNTAKSLLLRSLGQWMSGKVFERLLTKFTTPEEIFGPISVKGLKEDDYRRLTQGMLPETDLAFLDEIFKASSAILNTTLGVLNERIFQNGKTLTNCPLQICVAASNEWPHDQEGGKELGALFDRFLFRKKVRPIMSAAGRKRLLWERNHQPTFSATITPKEIESAHKDAMAIKWTKDGEQAFEEILRELAKEGVMPGDRRQFKAVGASQAFAYLSGDDKVEPGHLEILTHVLWDEPQEQPEKVAAVIGKIANPVGLKVNSLLLETEEILASTNVKDLGQAAAATKKLQNVFKQLDGLKSGNGRVDKAKQYVSEQVKRIKLATVEAL
ncbi:MAG: AAA family ATPase, partial [Terriglobia bacterium]